MVDEGPERLSGGNMGEVVRVGDTVIREAGRWTPAVHRLLDHLNAAGVSGVPKPLGTTDDRREILTFIEGTVPAYPMPRWVWAETALVSAARLLRSIHDASVDIDPAGPWRSPVHQPAEVICHNDFATYNLVFRDGEVIGAIDWDFASPGPRLWDLAYLAYRLVPMSSVDRADGFSDDERQTRLDRLLVAYGTDAAAHELLVMLHERLLDLADFSDRMAQTLDRPELSDHATLYRHDAASLPIT